ncbi:MAG TPA: hypothetical protein VM537_19265 [Anaerolineae bacterium]|nr:hypothetical protein [Anaerolineae bacterium]
MALPTQGTIQGGLDLIREFMAPVELAAQKAAAEGVGEDNSASYKDTDPNRIENQSKSSPASTSQTNLGQEQTQAAVDGGMNIEKQPENSEEGAKTPADTQGPQTLTTDDPVTSKGNIGPLRQQEITQEQKMARMDNLGNHVLALLVGEKQAACDHTYAEGSNECKTCGNMKKEAGKASKPSAPPPGAIPNDADGRDAGNNKTAAEEVFEHIQKTAAIMAQDYYVGVQQGLLKRAQDEAEVSMALAQNNIDPALIEKAGGVSGILDKVAMEYPEAVMPEGMMDGEMGGEMGGEMPPGMPPMPPEMGGEMGEMGGEGEVDLAQIAQALAEAGVDPQALQEALADVSQLQEGGIQPDALSGAISEVGAGGDPTAEAGGVPPAADAAAGNAAEAAAEGDAEAAASADEDDQKTAAFREKVAHYRAVLQRNNAGRE